MGRNTVICGLAAHRAIVATTRGVALSVLCIVAILALSAARADRLPASVADVSSLLTVGDLTRLPPDDWAVIVEVRDRPALREPRTGREHRLVAATYVRSNGLWFLRFLGHADEPAGDPVARNAVQMLAALWRSADRRWGARCSRLRGEPLAVWVSRQGEAGAEMWGSSLTVHDAHAARAPVEWLREIAHEYGHYLAPGGSGYTEPESWTNGVLGERLFASWLRADLREHVLAPECLPWVSVPDIEAYCVRQVDPLLERFRGSGPRRADLRRMDRRGFDACVELLLGVDGLLGGAILMDILEFVQTPNGRSPRGIDFEYALFHWIAYRGVLTARAGGAGVPPKVPLTRGVWRAAAEGRPVATVSVEANAWVDWPASLAGAPEIEWQRVSAAPARAKTSAPKPAASRRPRFGGGAPR